MRPAIILIIIIAFLASAAGGIFIFNAEKKILVENIPAASTLIPSTTSTSEIQEEKFIRKPEELINQVETLIAQTQKFIEEEKEKLALIEEVKAKSSKIKGIYIGSSRSANNFKTILDETELNGIVIDVKEAYGQNLPVSLKSLTSELHKENNWVIARMAVFRDSSLVEGKPEWYLMSTTSLPWQDKAQQYWLDPQNEEVQNYIIEFAKKAIDYGFDELQFDYIRYPDDYDYVLGTEKIKVIGDFFSKISQELRSYKPQVILSVDLFGYVATQFNSYGTGQRLIDAGKYFDYLSFMLYPSHFYGGFAAKGINFLYPDVVVHPYEVIYYSVDSARDYLSLLGLETKIRPWLQDFDLAVDSARGVVYDAEKIRFQIEAAQNATSSGWLLWNPSYVYTKEALMVE